MKLFSSKNPDGLHNLALWLCVITLPLIDMVNNVCLILLVLVWLIKDEPHKNLNRVITSKWTWPFFLYYLVLAIGSLYSSDQDNAVFTLNKKLTFVALPLIAVTGRSLRQQALSFIKRSFVYSCGAIVFFCLAASAYNFISGGVTGNFDESAQLQFIQSNPSAPSFWLNFSYIQLAHWADLHPAYLSMYLSFGVVILVTENYSSKREKIIHLILGLIISFSIALLSTRMAFLAFAGAASFLLIKEIQKRNLTEAVSIAGFISVIVFFLWLNPVAFFRVIAEPAKTNYVVDQATLSWNSVNYRLLEWRGSWSIIKEHWLMGIGTGAGEKALINFYSRFNSSTLGLTHNAHNQYLQTWMESGIFGLIAFLFCLTAFLLDKTKQPASYFAFLIIFSLMCLTESTGEKQKGIVFFTLFQSLYLGFEANRK